MPKCTGYPKSTSCNNDVPFVVDNESITFNVGQGKGSATVDLAKAMGELNAILPGNAQVTKYIGKLNLFCLCDGCWGKASAVWALASQQTASPQNASDYASAAAKATPDGLFFHVSEASFAKGAGINLDVIKMTTVHEMVHWSVSDVSQGFQTMAAGTETVLGLSSWGWDEVMTDHLAYKCFKRLRYGDYTTNYGNYLEFLDKATAAIVSLKETSFGFKTIKKNVSEVFGLDPGMTPEDFKLWVGASYKDKLFDELCYRYVKGNHATALGPNCPTNFKQFAEKVMVSFAGQLALQSKTY